MELIAGRKSRDAVGAQVDLTANGFRQRADILVGSPSACSHLGISPATPRCATVSSHGGLL